MICSLLLLHARDSEHIKNDLLKRLKGVPTHCICVDDLKVNHYEVLKNPTKSRLQIVFFSPGFLNFLECRPEEAYASFRDLDPQSTIALFCCGLREREVMCYHTAPLKSFYSWPKFETLKDEGNQGRFSTYFLEMIKDVFPDKSSKEIIIVPELINRESSHIYAIFPNAIQNMQDISAQLESSSCIEIIPESINPYVLQFTIPEMLLGSCETFTIKIQKSETFLAQKIIRIVKDEMLQEENTQDDFFMRRTSKIIQLDEQLQLLKEIGGSLETLEEDFEEKERSILPSNEEITISLKEMCKKYGLEELSPFIDDEPLMSVAETLRCVPGMCAPFLDQEFRAQNFGVQQDADPESERNLSTGTLPIDEIDGFSGIMRSLSLPTVLEPQEENHNASGDYLPMGFPRIRPRFPHLSSSDGLSLSESNVSSNTYVTMRRRSGFLEPTNKELTKSQEDLLKMMHAFKSGLSTLSEVEKRFQQWQEKHNPQDGPLLDTEKELLYPILFAGVSKRPDRKVSDESDKVNRLSGSSSQSRLSSSDTWRKFSSTSISSSNSSKTSDASSNITLQTKQRKVFRKLPHATSTGWIPSYSTTRASPLFSEKNPPPVPTRPIPLSNSRGTVDKFSKWRGSTRRKAGTYIPPVINDLRLTKNQDFKSRDNTDDNSLAALLQICEKYGLGNLGDYFFNELNQDNDDSAKTVNHVVSPKKEASEFLNQSCSHLPGGDWDPENTGSLQRSSSLPSNLFPTEASKTVHFNIEEKPNFLDRRKVHLQDSVMSKCEEYVNSIQSNIYQSIQAYISMQTQNESLHAHNLSASQQELLQIMNAFKKGEKTISQVEQQFEGWHMRHMGVPSQRDKQLLQLKNQFKQAQKSSGFGIKKFILGKPKNKNSKSSVASSKPVMRNAGKSKRDSRPLSKISYTSTSSGVSDNGDVFKNLCYFNPGYGETTQKTCRRNYNTSKVSSSSAEPPVPPPLPPRPPLTPVSILKHGFSNSDVSEAEKSPLKSQSQGSSPLMSVRKKPSPPPKPENLFKKVSGSTLVEHESNDNKDEVTRPESPTYIDPNKIMPASSRKNTQPTKNKQANKATPRQCSVKFEHACAKKTTKLPSSACSSTNRNMKASKYKEKTASSGVKTKQTEIVSPKRQILAMPSPWTKSKKSEESMFYIKRRCSSVPDLPSLEMHAEPIYLDLQELWDNRNRSISESNSPKE